MTNGLAQTCFQLFSTQACCWRFPWNPTFACQRWRSARSGLIHRSILCIQRIAWRGRPAKDRNVICRVSVVHRLNFICCLAGVLFFGLRLDLTLPLLPLPWCRWNGWAISWRIGAPWKMPSYANTFIEALAETPSGSSSSPCSHVLVKLASWE